MKKLTTLLVLSLLVLSMVLSACQEQPVIIPQENNQVTTPLFSGTDFNPGEETELITFSSEEELNAFLSQQASSSSNSYYGGGLVRMGAVMEESVDMAMDSVAAPTVKMGDGAESTSAGSLDYSETNNQVASVDEGDIIKTDGEYIYTLTNNKLFIVSAYPADDAELLDTVEFEGKRPTGLFIEGDTLLLYGNFYDADTLNELGLPSYTSMSYVTLYDMSDKENLVEIKEHLYEGNIFEARMIGDVVYIVANSYPSALPQPYPIMYDDMVAVKPAMDSIYYYPRPYDSVSFTSVHAVSLEDGKSETTTLAVESTRTLYMSEENIYLTYTEYVNEWDIYQEVFFDTVKPLISNTDKELITRIEAVDEDILSVYEKENKVMNILSSYVDLLPSKEQEKLEEEITDDVKKILKEYEYRQYTVITRVAVDGMDLTVEAHGEIPGYLNNQFSMDEHNNVLRVATTIGRSWSQFIDNTDETQNFIFTLDSDLEILDSKDGIAEGETIYSTRFMGDKLYMVTYKQVDPFFVVDLSDPENIEILGELKIPGFSRYLHPYSDDIIIGLGRDGTDEGRTLGLKIGLYDVSNPSKPVELTTFTSEERYASSTAEYEHKAFLFDREKELLVIPIYSYDWDEKKGRTGYNGALVFNITKDSISLRGLIDHSEGAQYRWSAAVERSLFIEDALYTKSYGLLRVNDLATLEGIVDIELDSIDTEMPVY